MQFIEIWLIWISFHRKQCNFKAPLGLAAGAGPQVSGIYFSAIRACALYSMVDRS